MNFHDISRPGSQNLAWYFDIFHYSGNLGRNSFIQKNVPYFLSFKWKASEILKTSIYSRAALTLTFWPWCRNKCAGTFWTYSWAEHSLRQLLLSTVTLWPLSCSSRLHPHFSSRSHLPVPLQTQHCSPVSMETMPSRMLGEMEAAKGSKCLSAQSIN